MLKQTLLEHRPALSTRTPLPSELGVGEFEQNALSQFRHVALSRLQVLEGGSRSPGSNP